MGCHKPAVAPGTGGGSSAPEEASAPVHDDAHRPPGTDDLTRFFRSQIPAQLKLKELKNDPPVPLPNSSPGSNTWLFNVRLNLALNEDLVGLPSPDDAHAFQSIVDELNGLVGWSRAYARSPYARLYPPFEMQVPTPASPQLLVIQQPKDKPLPPVYGKMAAEWQVDHWQISIVELQMPDLPGKLRSDFSAPNEIQGSPEEKSFLAAAKVAIAEANSKKAVIESGYRADLAKAAQAGTVYRGRISHGADAVPAEVRFVESPRPRFGVCPTGTASFHRAGRSIQLLCAEGNPHTRDWVAWGAERRARGLSHQPGGKSGFDGEIYQRHWQSEAQRQYDSEQTLDHSEE